MPLLYGLLVGITMGVLLQRVRASSPLMIVRNLRLENFTIIKFMALTIAVGAVGSYLLSALGMPMHFDVKPTYVLGVVLGGAIFGVGFALGGYCPGTCVVGAGEGRKDALFAILGGVVGAVAFTLAYPALDRALIKPMNYGQVTLPGLFHLPAVLTAFIMGAAILLIIRALPKREA
jgi:uncharacterized membrane protein YedE/YeeE